MLLKLRDLIFGYQEFEKTKFEVRFELIDEIINIIKLSNVEDFEILESVIYKIKELLRLKSSNLNKTIRDPSNGLRKKDVILVLEKLNKIKYDFLKIIFSKLKIKDIGNLSNSVSSEDVTIVSKGGNGVVGNDDKKSTESIDVKLGEKSNLNLANFLLFESSDFKVYLENKDPIFILIKFNLEFDLKIISKLSSLFFEVYSPEGTNIIVENNVAMIIPRFHGDKLFVLPNLDEVNLDEIYSKLIDNIKGKKVNSSGYVVLGENSIGDSNHMNSNENSNSIAGSFENTNFTSLRKKEETLDSLLEKQIGGKLDSVVENLEKNSNKNDLSEESKIEIIKGDINDGVNEKIEIIREDGEDLIEKSKIVILDNDKELDTDNKINNLDKVAKIDKIVDKEKIENFPIEKYEFYRDDKIYAFIQDKSSLLGEIIVKFVSGKILSEVSEGDLSYITIFTKVFSSVLFESLNAHGTNLIWDYSSSEIKIIPRFQDDNLSNLFLSGNQETSDFLELIKNKLLDKMNSEINSNSGGDGISEKESNVIGSNIDKNLDDKSSVLTKENIDEGGEELIAEKAKYILESLRRIP